jgi:hypothetical protein
MGQIVLVILDTLIMEIKFAQVIKHLNNIIVICANGCQTCNSIIETAKCLTCPV